MALYEPFGDKVVIVGVPVADNDLPDHQYPAVLDERGEVNPTATIVVEIVSAGRDYGQRFGIWIKHLRADGGIGEVHDAVKAFVIAKGAVGV